MTRYVLVHWTETNNTSIMEDDSVKDVSLLTNSRKEGMIYHKPIGKNAPKGGWKAYLGCVLSVHDSVKAARKKETAFLNEDKENNRKDMEQVRKRKRKSDDHFWSESETESGEDESTSKAKILPVKERKKMAIMAVERSLVFGDDVRTNSHDIETESGDGKLENLSQQQLIKIIRGLQKRLDLENAKQQLTNELPNMLVNALGNQNVLEKLKTLSMITTSQQPKASFAPLKLANVLSKSSSVAQTLKTSSVAQTPKKPESLSSVVSEQPSTPGPFDNVNVKTPKMEDGQFDMNKVRLLLTPSGLVELDRSKKFSKMTKTLMTSLFDRETLQKSTLAGKNGGDKLDVEKVEMIVGYVLKTYPVITRASVRNTISQKIKDEKEACKREKNSVS